MSRNYTAKQLRTILRDVVCNAFEHMESALKEIKKLQPEDSKDLTPETQARLKVINITLTMINDIIHPAHGISYQMFKGYEPMIDLYIKNQDLAFEKGLVPTCYCSSCDPDGMKAAHKAEEIRIRLEQEHAHESK